MTVVVAGIMFSTYRIPNTEGGNPLSETSPRKIDTKNTDDSPVRPKLIEMRSKSTDLTWPMLVFLIQKKWLEPEFAFTL